jgi:hypothetical protein
MDAGELALDGEVRRDLAAMSEKDPRRKISAAIKTGNDQVRRLG